MQIGQLETMGYSWRLLDEYPEKLKAMTSEQIQAVAKKYLVKDNMTIATLRSATHRPKCEASWHASYPSKVSRIKIMFFKSVFTLLFVAV